MAVNVFVSYSEKDHLAATLVGTLRRQQGVRIFIAHQARTPGMSIQNKVNEAIAHCHVFLLLWSARSQTSDWVAYEIEAAMRDGKRILPVLIEHVDLPPAIRDIEAVPLYQDADRWMLWLSQHLAETGAPPAARATGFNWGALIKGGVALAGLALAAFSASHDAAQKTTADEKPAEKKPAGKRKGRTGRSKKPSPPD